MLYRNWKLVATFVEQASAATKYRVGRELIGETQAWCPVFSVYRRRPQRRSRKYGCALISTSWNIDSRVHREITELGTVESLRVGITPFIAEGGVTVSFRRDLPVVLNKEGGLHGLVSNRWDDACNQPLYAKPVINVGENKFLTRLHLRVHRLGVPHITKSRKTSNNPVGLLGCQKLLKNWRCSPPNLKACRPRTHCNADEYVREYVRSLYPHND